MGVKGAKSPVSVCRICLVKLPAKTVGLCDDCVQRKLPFPLQEKEVCDA